MFGEACESKAAPLPLPTGLTAGRAIHCAHILNAILASGSTQNCPVAHRPRVSSSGSSARVGDNRSGMKDAWGPQSPDPG